MILKRVPEIVGHGDVFPQDSLSSLVVKDETLSNVLKLGGGSELGAIGASVNHEGRVDRGNSSLGSQVRCNSGGSDLASVIQVNFNWHGTKQVVQENSISNVSPGGLK